MAASTECASQKQEMSTGDNHVESKSCNKLPETDDFGHHILYHQHSPLLFRDAISAWPAFKWTPETLCQILKDAPMTFRMGHKHTKDVQWETECEYESATMTEFVDWVAGGTSCGTLCKYDTTTAWGYFDYKHISQEFPQRPDLLQAVDWSSMGFPGRGGEKSTFWLGSTGAHTQCHYDTYGCNLVAQIYGRKRWVIFPPSDTKYLYPTRVPYEESSVFSRVNVPNSDLHRHSEMKNTTPYIVTLEPGDVLFVPRHWWHDVTSLTTSISINTWLELPEDQEERIREAITRTLVTSIMQDSDSKWLNPTEEFSSPNENLQSLQAALMFDSTGCEGAPRRGVKRKYHKDIETTVIQDCKQAGFCNCSPPVPTMNLAEKAQHLSPCTFQQMMAQIGGHLEQDKGGTDSPADIDSDRGVDVTLAEAVSHPDVIRMIHEKLCCSTKDFGVT